MKKKKDKERKKETETGEDNSGHIGPLISNIAQLMYHIRN